MLKDNKVLLIGARDNKDKLFWSFPKGRQEPNETDIETALRKTKEEVGLDVEIIDISPIINHNYVSNHYHYRQKLRRARSFFVHERFSAMAAR